MGGSKGGSRGDRFYAMGFLAGVPLLSRSHSIDVKQDTHEKMAMDDPCVRKSLAETRKEFRELLKERTGTWPPKGLPRCVPSDLTALASSALCTRSGHAAQALQKKTKEAKPPEEIPREALKCHMCVLTKFGSIKEYETHLESKNHEEMARLYNAKEAALLQLLRAESKLASLRNTVKMRKMGVKGRFMQCFRCQTRIFGNLAKHVETTEHQALSDFLNRKCCSRWFPSRVDLEEHRLSLLHLRRQYEFEKRKKAEDEKEKTVKEESKVAENATPDFAAWRRLIHQLDQLKALHNHPSEMTLGTIPAYDPAAPTGTVERVLDRLMKDCDAAALKPAGPFRREETTDKVNSQEDIAAEAENETAAEEEEVKGDADMEDAKKTEEEGSKEEDETKEATDDDEAKEEKPRAVSQSPSTPRGRRGRARGRGRSARGAKN